MCLLLAGNDTVPTLMWSGGGVRCIECRLVISTTQWGKNEQLAFSPDSI